MDPTELFAFFDMNTQSDLIDPGGAWPVTGADEIVKNLTRLVQFAAERGIPIVASVDINPVGSEFPDGVPPHCLAGTPGSDKIAGTILPDSLHLGPEKGEVPSQLPPQIVLEAVNGDPFKNPNAMAVIERIYGRTAVIFGVALEDRILQAVRGLRKYGLPCRVVWDVARGRDAESATRAERSIIETGALLVTADEIIREIDLRSQSSAS